MNTSGVATSYGVDVDTFNVTALLAPGQTSATTQFSAGGDLVLLAAQVVSATSEPVVDLSLTKTHAGNFTVGGTNVYTLTVANAAGWQREDNAVVVTDTLPAGLTYVSGVGTGWTCGAAAQVVTCTHPPTLNSGQLAAADRVDGRSDGRRRAERRRTRPSVSSASFDVERRERHGDGYGGRRRARISRRRRRRVVDLNGGEPEPGDTVRYTITLVESAGVAATASSVVDDLAAELGSLAVVSVPAGAVDASTGAGTGANGTGRVNVTQHRRARERQRGDRVRRPHRGRHAADDADRQHGDDRQPRRTRRGARRRRTLHRVAVGVAVVGLEAAVSAQHAGRRVVAQSARSTTRPSRSRSARPWRGR